MSGVSSSWQNQVSSYTLFSTIVRSIKEVVDENNKKQTKQVKSKQNA